MCCKKFIHASGVAIILAAAAGAGFAVEPETPSAPVVRAGREPGEVYGPPAPPEIANQAADDPGARGEWFKRQRSHPFADIPADGYDSAAREYLRRRELTRLRHLQTQNADGVLIPAGPLPTGPWSEVGPAPINPSGFAYGSVAGRVSAVALHPSNNNILLVGASRGGLWRTIDNGATWTPVGDNQNTLVIADIEFAPSNPLIVYAATGDDDISFWGAGVLKSLDGGITWARVDNGNAVTGISNGTILSKIAVDPTNANLVTAAGWYKQDPTGGAFFSFMFHSADGGATWSQSAIPSTGNQAEFRSLIIEPNCPANLWALNYRDHTVNRSVNGGVTWTATASAGLPAFTGNTQLAVQHASCAGSATLYASVQTGDALAGTANYPGVYRSIDNGASWALPGAAGPTGGCLRQCGYDHFLLVDPADAARVYMIGRDLWTSANSGATWTNRSGGFDDSNNYFGGNMHVDMHDLAIRGTGAAAVIYVAGDGGLWSYDVTANSFTNRNGNLAISEFMDFAADPDTPNQGIGGLQDNGSIAYTGTSVWPYRLGGDGGAGGYLRTIPGAGNPFDGAFTTYVGNTGYKSVNSGAVFSTMSGDTSFSSESAEFYGPWIGTLGNNRIWHGAQSLWSCDFPAGCTSATWTKFGVTNLAAITASAYVSKLAINNPSSGSFGPFYAANAYPRAFLQSNDGLTWNNRTAGLPDRYISRIEFDPATPANVWVTLQGFGTGHLWFSANGGATWADKSGNLPNVPVNSILLDPEDRANVWYLATDTGVYGTINGSAGSPTWTVAGTGLPVVMVADLELDQNRALYAATGGRSVWRITLPSSSGCSFVGLASVTNNSTATCRLDLAWAAAPGACGPVTKYNVYRSTTNGVLGSRVAACQTGLSYSDQSALNGTTYYYTVRAEAPAAGAGPCGGTEESNLVQRSGVAGGTVTVTAFTETAESGSGLNGWATSFFGTQNGNDASDWRGIETCVNHTSGGSRDFRNGGIGCAAATNINKWAFAVPGGAGGVAIPAGATTARLNFWHMWDYELNYDGAHLFVSTNGVNYYSVTGAAILAGGTNGTLIEDAAGCGFNRPGGVGWPIWTGTSTAAFTNTIVDLDAACNGIPGNVGGCAGKSVRIGFTENTDCAFAQAGWFLDDVLVTYQSAGSCSAASVPAEVSAGATALRLAKNGATNLNFAWQDLALSPQDYNLYQGTLGTWYSHAIFNCHLTTPAITCGAGSCSVPGLVPAAASRYYLVTAAGPGGEGNAGGAGWSGPNHTSAPVYSVPAACGGN